MKLIAAALAALLPCLAATMAMDADKAKAIGNPAAPVRIDIFSDFECPACANFHSGMLPALIQDYAVKGKVYLVSHEFPLTMHKFSHDAANYATAAARVGKYSQVADVLFQNQAGWSANGNFWEFMATVLTPVEKKRVQDLAKDPSVIAEVNADLMLGQRQAINSTPTLIVTHGERTFSMPWPINYNLFRSMIDGFLK
jgi:protein-disulfide isomerase